MGCIARPDGADLAQLKLFTCSAGHGERLWRARWAQPNSSTQGCSRTWLGPRRPHEHGGAVGAAASCPRAPHHHLLLVPRASILSLAARRRLPAASILRPGHRTCTTTRPVRPPRRAERSARPAAASGSSSCSSIFALFHSARPRTRSVQAVYTINPLGLRELSRGPWRLVSVPTCFHTSTIPYRLSLKANLMSLIDLRGTRAD